jgi:predicted porin
MTTSRIALAAAAGLLLGAAMTPAKAADLGGGCCADLEERVAELEATTARKGNRVVSLQVYGQVNKALLIWDDGIDSDAFVVDNTLASSRVGLIGKAAISPGMTAGYNIELEIMDARADEVNNWEGKSGDEGSDGLKLRQNYWYIESDKLGRISVGHQSTAADGASEVVLGNSMRNADPNIGSSFCIRTNGAADCVSRLNTTTTVSGSYAQWAEDFTADRLNDIIRYDTPSFYGFVLSASWGDNDFADVALRFKKEFNGLRVAAAVAYQWDDQNEIFANENLAGSFSVMHVPTGLYGAFSAGNRKFTGTAEGILDDQSFWYVQGGIERKWLPYGSTTLYGEYGQYNSFWASFSGIGNDSKAERVGFGINQKVDAAAMDIYANATFWSFEDKYWSKGFGVEYQDLTTVMVGSRIQF